MAAGADKGRSARGQGGVTGPNGVVQKGAGTGLIDLDFVRGLIEAVDDSSIDTLEINRGGTRIRISKTPPPAGNSGSAAMAQPAQTIAAATVAETAPASEPVVLKTNLTEVKSPMVGTFYRSPAPEAPPYVEVGAHVSKGQTLCILEAMKLMNELESEVDGIVREVLVENADPVEYGEVLFRIEPAGSQA